MSAAAALQRALGYPYPRPGGSYFFVATPPHDAHDAHAGLGGFHCLVHAWQLGGCSSPPGADGALAVLGDVAACTVAAESPWPLAEFLVARRGWPALLPSAPLAARVPVLAYGSNASPVQLARKFCAAFAGADTLADRVVPVLRGL